uniref:UEV domain-containing protein n=1 Tax=Poecilia latipinna TaxID=48699 RepID=A0A3B3V3W5_9TELE
MLFNEEMIRKMLPRAYQRKHVAHQIYVSMSYFKNLMPVVDEYVYKDGTTKSLMSLTGTIPVVFSGNSVCTLNHVKQITSLLLLYQQ